MSSFASLHVSSEPEKKMMRVILLLFVLLSAKMVSGQSQAEMNQDASVSYQKWNCNSLPEDLFRQPFFLL
jgi:hypothetical protein